MNAFYTEIKLNVKNQKKVIHTTMKGLIRLRGDRLSRFFTIIIEAIHFQCAIRDQFWKVKNCLKDIIRESCRLDFDENLPRSFYHSNETQHIDKDKVHCLNIGSQTFLRCGLLVLCHESSIYSIIDYFMNFYITVLKFGIIH